MSEFRSGGESAVRVPGRYVASHNIELDGWRHLCLVFLRYLPPRKIVEAISLVARFLAVFPGKWDGKVSRLLWFHSNSPGENTFNIVDHEYLSVHSCNR